MGSSLWAKLLDDTLLTGSVKQEDQDKDDMITFGNKSFAPSHYLTLLNIGCWISKQRSFKSEETERDAPIHRESAP